ncbi:MAG: hypothetical protein QOJ13_2699 [Gaiellales bacterium]|nr:hypothetical protein [Gaiellales bacterium]
MGMSVRFVLVVLSLAALVAACGGTSTGGATEAKGELRVRVFAGPTCPVETVPPNPECEPRPVEQAVIELDGPEHITIEVKNGSAAVGVLPGTYTVVPRPVPGLMGTPEPTKVRVVAGHVTPLQLSYDTGIR